MSSAWNGFDKWRVKCCCIHSVHHFFCKCAVAFNFFGSLLCQLTLHSLHCLHWIPTRLSSDNHWDICCRDLVLQSPLQLMRDCQTSWSCKLHCGSSKQLMRKNVAINLLLCRAIIACLTLSNATSSSGSRSKSQQKETPWWCRKKTLLSFELNVINNAMMVNNG